MLEIERRQIRDSASLSKIESEISSATLNLKSDKTTYRNTVNYDSRSSTHNDPESRTNVISNTSQRVELNGIVNYG